MLILLAESKTMSAEQHDISTEEFKLHTPQFETEADEIMAYIEKLTPHQISEILGISSQLAAKAHNLAYEFPHKATGYMALYGYTGEAFRGLDAATLSETATETAFTRLKFISSVYGLLNASDLIKPYRNEFNKAIAPGGKTPIQFFKQKVTIALVNHIKENKIKEVVNLLPGDADKSIDWKIVRAFAKVEKICFQSMTPEGKLKTPIAKRLKELRGLMTRTILMNGIKNFNELSRLESKDYIYSPGDSKPLLPVFITD